MVAPRRKSAPLTSVCRNVRSGTGTFRDHAVLERARAASTGVAASDTCELSGGGGTAAPASWSTQRVIVRVPLACEPLYPAVTVATRAFFVGFVAIGNEAVFRPAGTVTFGGTDASDELLESETTAPVGGAAQLRVSVPVAGEPPTTPDGSM